MCLLLLHTTWYSSPQCFRSKLLRIQMNVWSNVMAPQHVSTCEDASLCWYMWSMGSFEQAPQHAAVEPCELHTHAAVANGRTSLKIVLKRRHTRIRRLLHNLTYAVSISSVHTLHTYPLHWCNNAGWTQHNVQEGRKFLWCNKPNPLREKWIKKKVHLINKQACWIPESLVAMRA